MFLKRPFAVVGGGFFLLICVYYGFLDILRDFESSQLNPEAKGLGLLANKTDKASSESPYRRMYFVNSSKCRMPYVDPFTSEAMKIYKPVALKVCSKEGNLFGLSFDNDSMRYSLHVNESALLELSPLDTKVECNFRGVTKSIGSSVEFSKNHQLARSISGVIVECHEEGNASHILQQDSFPLVQVKNYSPYKQPAIRKPSVIILGLDSMSRINLPRTMPKTKQFVSQEGWFELQGYNKVADNTMPNVYTVLSGTKVEQAMMLNWHQFRDVTWIWTQYKRAGYATAITEDVISLPIFEDIYIKAEADYFLRPLLLQFAFHLKSYISFGYDYCIGRRLAFSYVYDFCGQFIARYTELNRPVFGFFWSCTFTHDFFNVATSLDELFVGYLHQFQQLKLFEESIVILLSDHGARFGELMELPSSFLEERLPMLHIYLPPWFRAAYPQYAQALALNRNRLSSNFDLHNTLRHLLQLDATTPAGLPPLSNCPTSQSLLHPLSEERSCQEACIMEHWCTCNEYDQLAISENMILLTKWIVKQINEWMLEEELNKKCQRLSFARLDEVHMKKLLPEENLFDHDLTLRFRFQTNPPVGKFRVTVLYNLRWNEIRDLQVPEISRINSYRTDAPCVWSVAAKKFCFCYPKTKTDEMNAWTKARKFHF